MSGAAIALCETCGSAPGEECRSIVQLEVQPSRRSFVPPHRERMLRAARILTRMARRAR